MDYAAMEVVNMAKAPSYEGVTLDMPAEAPAAPARRLHGAGKGSTKDEPRTLKDAAVQTVIYLHPAAAKALKRYALDQDVKVHDLLIEALEGWFKSHGLQGPVRAETARRK
jgi:hypothetical protein